LFFQLRCKWQNYLWHEQLEFFLGHLTNERIIPRWQVVQAEQAVRLYFVHFLGSSTEPKSLVEIDEQGMFDTASSLQQLVTTLRLKRYARRTEKTYLFWLESCFRFVCAADPACPQGKSSADPRHVKDFLAQLVVKHNVAAGTQNQAFYSLLFFFRSILKRDIGDMKEALRAQQRRRLPVVLSVSETQRLLGQIEGTVSPLDRLGDHGGSSTAASCSQGKPVEESIG
jgi:hypothetical protein